MTTFPGSPRLLKGGIVLLNADSAVVQQRIIILQYNPDTLSRSLQPQTIGGESGDRLEALRLKAPPIETIKLEAEIDATDQLALSDADTLEYGVYRQLAALETILYPSSSQVQNNRSIAQLGTLEIAPIEAPLSLFIWSKHRIAPVRITEFSITEEAFDPLLNPIRARVSLGMRVLSSHDLGAEHRGSNIFMAYHQKKEQMADLIMGNSLTALGIDRIP